MPFTDNDPNINRNGRPPKGESWAELIRQAGSQTDPVTKKQLKVLVVEQLYFKAVSGDISAIREIIDRTDGKPKMVDKLPTQSFADQVNLDDPRILRTLLLTAQAIGDEEDVSQQ